MIEHDFMKTWLTQSWPSLDLWLLRPDYLTIAKCVKLLGSHFSKYTNAFWTLPSMRTDNTTWNLPSSHPLPPVLFTPSELAKRLRSTLWERLQVPAFQDSANSSPGSHTLCLTFAPTTYTLMFPKRNIFLSPIAYLSPCQSLATGPSVPGVGGVSPELSTSHYQFFLPGMFFPSSSADPCHHCHLSLSTESSSHRSVPLLLLLK